MDVRLLVRGEAEFGGEAVEVLERLRGHVVKVDEVHGGVHEGEEEGGARAYLQDRKITILLLVSMFNQAKNSEVRREKSVSDRQFDRLGLRTSGAKNAIAIGQRERLQPTRSRIFCSRG